MQQWTKALTILSGQMTQATYDMLLAGTSLEQQNGHYVIHCTSSQNKEILEHRWADKVSQALGQTMGQAVTVKFEAQPYYLPDPEPARAEPGQPDLDVIGAYLDKRNAIIQPEKVMVFTQYFRLNWWPILKPVESLLVMELRQRCHHKSGRNSCQATYADLARAINVSEITVKRLLAKNKSGEFKSEHLGQFIKAVETIKTSNGQGNIRNLGSKFIIVLDDPLTPQDAADLA